jgi:DNA invertase Pin-like site-specific DNA recombinase
MKVIYGRISTEEQNEERQLEKGVLSFIDRCSGTISFFDRPQAKKLVEYIKNNPQTETSIKSVDRIGRSTIDILNTAKFFKENNYLLKIEDLGLNNNSPFFDLMISMLGTLAEFEKKNILERVFQGVNNAKAKGIYIGRKKGTVDSRAKILEKHKDVVECLNKGMKISTISQILHKNRTTIYKVKQVL